MEQGRKRVWRRRLLIILAGLAVSAGLGGIAAWRFPQQILTVDSGPVTADAIVVLGGTPDRAVRATELFKQGEAPKILVSGRDDAGYNQKLLKRNGVTNAAIILENESRTTQENAKFSIPLLRQMGAHRVILVTSWYHSRRALACFEHYAPDIKFYSRPSYFMYAGNPADGGRTAEDGGSTPHPVLSPAEAERVQNEQKAEWKMVRGYVKSEYLKVLGYWACYGVCPL